MKYGAARGTWAPMVSVSWHVKNYSLAHENVFL